MSTLRDDLRHAFRVSTPLVAVSTTDPATACQEVVSAGKDQVFAWDVSRGLYGLTKLAESYVAEHGGQDYGASFAHDPVRMLVEAGSFPDGSVTVMHSADSFLSDAAVAQSLWNLRDPYKASFRAMVCVAPSFDWPAMLRHDVLEFRQPLPNPEELESIVTEVLSAAGDQLEWEPSARIIDRVVQSLRGASAFAAEQITAMCLRKAGLDWELLGKQCRSVVERTPGLSYERGSETIEDVVGLEAIRSFGHRLFAGPLPPSVVVRVEELEKTMAGATGGDLSGTSSDALQVLLSEMEDNGWTGILAFGAPGSGKSLFGKALANSYGARPLRLDINATKGSLVGQSEQAIRQAVDVIKTIGGDRVFFIASCNRLESLPAELQRRFRAGVWFFDLPDQDGCRAMWEMYGRKYNVDLPDELELGLSGADVRNICETAYRLGVSVEEARQFVVPLKVQSPESIASARKQAMNRFIDASRGGPYRGTRDSESSGRSVVVG